MRKILAPESTLSSQTLNVLWIEDDIRDVNTALTHLNRDGFGVHADVVDHVGEFEAALGARSYDVVLSTYRLPGYTALDALEILRRNSHDIPFILVAEPLDEKHAAETLHAGASEFVSKRRMPHLSSALRRVLAGRATGNHAATALQAKLDSLETAKSHAEEASRAKTEFLAMMSHEIRSPMNAILGTADLLCETTLDAEQTEYVHMFQRCGENLLSIINEILDFSKVEAGQVTLESVTFHLATLIDSLTRLTAPAARHKGIEIHFGVAPDLPPRLVGDPGRLRQILHNLIDNAIKFTTGGEIRVRVEPRPGADRLGQLLFSVADTGIGIPPEKLDRIFENFTQAEDSTTRRFGGSGLGLAICKRLAELMGGHISVESAPDKGSTFRLAIPFGVPDKLGAGAPSESDDLQVGSEPQFSAPPELIRILVAEDSQDNVFLIQRYLRDFNCQLDVAESGAKAFDMFRSGCYDLVLMDIQMPDMDGYSATRLIRQWELAQGHRRVPIVAVTAHVLPDELERIREAGCDAHLTKPYRGSILRELVQRHGQPSEDGSTPIRVFPPSDLHDLIPGYLENRVRDIQLLHRAIEEADYDRAASIGHDMKGTGASYGFAVLSEIGRSINDAGRKHDLARLRRQTEALETTIQRIEVIYE